MASIPAEFVKSIEKGLCTLFLGAGASISAKAPSGKELGQILAEKYLGDSWWDLGLERTASIICAVSGKRPDIECELQEALNPLEPSAAHMKIPWFSWRAIVTTNYDRLVEKAYDKEPFAAQKPKIITEDLDLGDRESPRTLQLIKPHGCISQPHGISVSSEDIYEAKGKRLLLFKRIENLHIKGPVVYVGYSLNDRHILDMIYDLTKRLGNRRAPILFVTHQTKPSRAAMERQWFEKKLQGEYLPCGFQKFMDQLARNLRPAVAPSFIIPQMAPCEAWTFGTGTHSLVKGKDGEWECWLDYAIASEEGFAGVLFERRGTPLDLTKFKRIAFELNVPDAPRKEDCFEALKLEGTQRVFLHLNDIGPLKGKGWREVSFNIKKSSKDLPRHLQRIVLADNGSRATLGQAYRIGIRKVRFG